jgi:hypothetical protein
MQALDQLDIGEPEGGRAFQNALAHSNNFACAMALLHNRRVNSNPIWSERAAEKAFLYAGNDLVNLIKIEMAITQFNSQVQKNARSKIAELLNKETDLTQWAEPQWQTYFDSLCLFPEFRAKLDAKGIKNIQEITGLKK